MSLDYPLYEEMVRRKSRAAPWWRTGDILYYLGLLTAIFAIPASMAHVQWSGAAVIVLWYALVFISGVAIFIGGLILKAYSYRLAKRDGIDPSQF